MPRPQLDRTKLLSLIASVYDAVEDARGWEAMLRDLCHAVGAGGVGLISHDLMASGAAVMHSGVDPEAVRLYNDYYHRVDVWAETGKRLLSGARPTQVLVDQQLISRHQLQKAEYYPYARKFNLSRLMLSVLDYGALGISGLSVLRGDNDPPFTRHEVVFLERLSPHLRRGLKVHGMLAQATRDRNAALGGFDALAIGILFVRGDSSVVHANRTAAKMLRENDGLSAARLLAGATPVLTSALRRLCAECAATSKGEGCSAGGALNCARPSGRRPLHVVVSPLKDRHRGDLRDDRVAALVIVSDPDRDTMSDVRILQAIYGLTAVEAKIAALIAAGRSSEEISDQCGYTRQTLAWYSKQILAKTACRNRAALVRELSRSISSLANACTTSLREN